MGLEYFSSCCEEMGIDFEKVFCHGEGKTYYSKSKNSKRYEFTPTEKQWSDTHQYVIKYFSKDKIFICWDLKYNIKPKRIHFSASYLDVIKALENSQISFVKGKEFANNNNERVYVFKNEQVLDFLRLLKN